MSSSWGWVFGDGNGGEVGEQTEVRAQEQWVRGRDLG